MSDARQTRYDRRHRSCRTNSEFDSIRGEYRFFECRKTGSQTESKNRFIRFFPYWYTTLFILIIKQHLDLRILSYIKLYHVHHCAMIVIHKMSRRLQNELLVFLWLLMAIAKLIDPCMLFYESPLPWHCRKQHRSFWRIHYFA